MSSEFAFYETLSALMLIYKSNMTRRIRSINEEALVRQHRSETDLRTRCLYLSELAKQDFSAHLGSIQ
jgi:DNA-binding MarR family transcriptional regulator